MKSEDIQKSILQSQELSKYVQDCKFTKYDFTVRHDLVGRQISMRVEEIAKNLNEIINELPKFKYLVSVYDARVKEAMGKATSIIMEQFPERKFSAKERNERILFCEITLALDSKPTKPYDEQMKFAAIKYIVDVGEAKMELGLKMLEYARSLLSYNKTEIGVNN